MSSVARTPLRPSARSSVRTKKNKILHESHTLFVISRYYRDGDNSENLTRRMRELIRPDGRLGSFHILEERQWLRLSIESLWSFMQEFIRAHPDKVEGLPAYVAYMKTIQSVKQEWIQTFLSTLDMASKGGRSTRENIRPPTDEEWDVADTLLSQVLALAAHEEEEREPTRAAFFQSLSGGARQGQWTKRWLLASDTLREFRFVVRPVFGIETEEGHGIPASTPFDFAIHQDLVGIWGFSLLDFAVPVPFMGTGMSIVLRFMEDTLARSMQYSFILHHYVHQRMLDITLNVRADGYRHWLPLESEGILARDEQFNRTLTEMAVRNKTAHDKRWVYAYNPEYGTGPVNDLVFHIFWLSPSARRRIEANQEALLSPAMRCDARITSKDPLRFPKSGVSGMLCAFAKFFWDIMEQTRSGKAGPELSIGLDLSVRDRSRKLVIVVRPHTKAGGTFRLYISPCFGEGPLCFTSYMMERSRPIQMAFLNEMIPFVMDALLYDKIAPPARILLNVRMATPDLQEEARQFVNDLDMRPKDGNVKLIPGTYELGVYYDYERRRTNKTEHTQKRTAQLDDLLLIKPT